MAFKLVISDPKSGKSYQKEFEQSGLLVGKKVGETINGEVLGLSG
ncbi:TPA: 30S ribosomal protein S6e, partial [archaeon]|nr:30S ribosomal protein S6e [Candidatus Naiadarchaeales archaeon SRR2090159.bin1288]